MVQKMCSKKQGAKNQGHCYSKREEEARLLLLFFSNNVPAFCNPYFESFSSSRVLTAYNAALQLSVSKTVSIKNKSAPPSNKPLACS